MKKIISVVLIVVIILTFCACGKDVEVDKESLKSICELASLEVRYNNVGTGTKNKGENWWNVLEKNRKFWVEYEGSARIGIDMDKVQIDSKKNTIYITMPEAELLDVKVVTETLTEESYTFNKDGWLDKNIIEPAEENSAIEQGQAEMVSSIMENKSLFDRAKKVAMENIENYYKRINELTGTNYKIEWK